MRKKNLQPESESGQSLVELGVVLVILLTLLSGAVDIGRIFFEYQAMRDAAQEGAIYSSIYPASCNQTMERVRQSLINLSPDAIQVEIRVNGVQCTAATAADACADKEIKVTVRQPNFPLTMPFLGTILGRESISLSADITSSVVRPPCP